jgi:hypothetical protein
MNTLIIPLGLTVAALVAAFAAYRGIRRGSARFYSLERESILRRAGFTLAASVFLFLAAIVLLLYNQQQSAETVTVVDAITAEPGVPTPTAPILLEAVPPTFTPTPTPDPNAPQPTPTPFIRRGVIEGTGGSGAYLRDNPGTNTETVEILDDGAIVTLVDGEDPIDANGYLWIKVRTIGGVEGWVADLFLTVSER